MAAVSIRPQESEEHEGMLHSALNVIILLVWWVVVYAFFVFPEEYIITDLAVYSARWDLLYLVGGVTLIAFSASAFLTSSGTWRELYRNVFFATTLYTFSSEAINAALARGPYKTGQIYHLPSTVATLGFLWMAVSLTPGPRPS